MKSTPTAERSAPDTAVVKMKRSSRYHGADIAQLVDDLVEAAWLERRAKVPKHAIFDALLLMAVENQAQLPEYLIKLAERRSTWGKD